jgi:hypothetical protein
LSRDIIEKEDRIAMNEWLKKNKVSVCPPYLKTDEELIVMKHPRKKKKSS